MFFLKNHVEKVKIENIKSNEVYAPVEPGPGPWPTGKLPVWLLFKMAKGGRLL